MNIAFASMEESDRAPLMARYVESLRRRNGEISDSSLQLPAREGFLARWAASNPGWSGRAPTEAYQRIVGGGAIHRDDPRLALWMAYMAMTNQAEEYGVNVRLDDELPGEGDEKEAYQYIAREELYHTRMLLDGVRALGVNASLAPPPLGLRLFLRFFPRLPTMWTDCITLIAEAVGITLFCRLRAIAMELFEGTSMGAHLTSLVDEIIIDEVGHVTFLRSRLGERGLRWARRLSPVVIPLLMRSFPMAGPLLGLEAYRRMVDTFTWDDLPPGVRARAFGPYCRDTMFQAVAS
ncbi:MAG: ferritin-like domain-containing protein [Deltaproteobacteria bacterium]|nr:ferritin-like domain-containing protein [Deltaproteobacteria bacterium]